ncbi:hypothetical protein [Roseiconus lacunae]|uniref:DUF4145 domain-containing protein n=1 Tax=Roseiconus lacunae TaxID=2605694 RepID=A0ABT7PES6_9BACT|nr:hypothetical protein [Roseiconus lacunae]MDM4014987.1 hypothetical protein [Roseiconus lacunae]
MLGTLEAALSDFQEGYLFDVKRLITGDVFSDILDQSQHLLHSGYHQAAMVLGGAVLEDTLRSLCSRHDIDTPSKPKLDKMNADLAKAGCYTKLVQKRITGIADVRNSAAHGKWDEFSEDDVRDALSWIVRFVGDNCG